MLLKFNHPVNTLYIKHRACPNRCQCIKQFRRQDSLNILNTGNRKSVSTATVVATFKEIADRAAEALLAQTGDSSLTRAVKAKICYHCQQFKMVFHLAQFCLHHKTRTRMDKCYIICQSIPKTRRETRYRGHKWGKFPLAYKWPRKHDRICKYCKHDCAQRN